MNKAIKIWKGFEIRPIVVGIEGGAEVCERKTQKRELYSQVIKSIGLHCHPPTRKQNFWRNLIIAWNGCSETKVDP